MLRLFPLRRSFSLDLGPDDSNSNFFLHLQDESNYNHHISPQSSSPPPPPPQPQHPPPSNTHQLFFSNHLTNVTHFNNKSI
ncbi:hypothetical protein QR98_0067810 [Sarcoptes scabiei]|uniref:Uncharacterized protein n=1 Tax=Sarcoptes scabiei TaxID=52283 RepID=A0A132ACG0_SARSC|nr:hypothetical protein QR98_0067810 [Sarcoptes scabiei]